MNLLKMDLTKLKLPDLERDEYVITIVWHHWFVFAKEFAGLVLLFILPFVMIPFVVTMFVGQNIAVGGAPPNLVIFFSAFWALIIWNVVFTRWTDFYYDVWIITNWRIIDINQIGLFKRDISSILNLDHIQDIQTKVDGIIRTLLDYGDIEVQTAAAKREFLFDDVASPRKVEKLVRDAQAELLRLNKASHRYQEVD